jgi:hypothetical protein
VYTHIVPITDNASKDHGKACNTCSQEFWYLATGGTEQCISSNKLGLVLIVSLISSCKKPPIIS